MDSRDKATGKTFARHAKRLMRERGLTAAKLAEAIGRPRSTVRDVVEKATAPNVGLACDIARELGVGVEEMVGAGGGRDIVGG